MRATLLPRGRGWYVRRDACASLEGQGDRFTLWIRFALALVPLYVSLTPEDADADCGDADCEGVGRTDPWAPLLLPSKG